MFTVRIGVVGTDRIRRLTVIRDDDQSEAAQTAIPFRATSPRWDDILTGMGFGRSGAWVYAPKGVPDTWEAPCSMIPAITRPEELS